MGGQGVVRRGFHGGIIASRCVEGHCFASDFPLAYRWVMLKSFGHPAIEFFDKGVGFSWRAYRGLDSDFTCAN